MRPQTGTDWEQLMRLGLGVLRLSPHDFWSMTPREFQCALEGAGVIDPAAVPPRRGDFEALMRRFPDSVKGAPDAQ